MEDFVQRGKELILRKEFQEAVRVCRLGLLGRPGQVEGRLLLGTALLSLGRLDEVLAEMRVALEHEKDSVLAHLIKGEALLRKGDSRHAEEVYARVLELDPQNALARKNLEASRQKTQERFAPREDEDRAWREQTPPVEIHSEDVEEEEPVPDAVIEAKNPRRATTSEVNELLDELAAPSRAASPVPVTVVDPPEGPVTVPVSQPGRPLRRTTQPDRPSARSRRTWPLFLLAFMVLAGGVWGGWALLQKRRAERVRDRVAAAHRMAAAQTLPAFRAAEADLLALLAHEDRPEVRGALIKVRAAMRAELGVGEGPIEDPRAAGSDAAQAAAYAALGTPSAVERARALPPGAESSYLLGRALGATPEGIAALESSVAAEATPLAWTALGEARAQRGLVDGAAAAFRGALELEPDHPAAVIAEARLLARAGRLPDRPNPEAALEAIARDAGGPEPRVSERQAALAAVALAEVALARRDPGKAAAALEAGPRSSDPAVVEGRVRVLLGLGETSAARAAAEDAARGHAAAHLWLAEIAVKDNQLEAASAALAAAGPAAASADGRRVAAEIALARGNLPAAATALDESLALRADPGAARLRAEVDVRRGDWAAARPRVEALYKETREPASGVLLAEVLRRQGEHAAARGVIDEVMPRIADEQGELPGRAHVVAARLYREEGRYAEAQTEYAAALAARPKDRDARLEAGLVAWDTGNLALARATLEALAADAPADSEALLATARVRTAAGDTTGAQKLIDAAARRGAAKGAVAREAGRAALAAGRTKEAVGKLAAAAKASPKDGEMRLLYLEALLQAKAAREAAAEMQAIRADFPDGAVADLARGREGLARGNAADAAAGYAAAVKKLEPTAPPREVAAALAGLGAAHLLADKPDAAVDALRRAAKLEPTSATIRVDLGRALAAKREYAAAAEALGEAVKRDPASSEAYFLLGDIELKRRKKASARWALTQYLKLEPKGEYALAAKKLLRQAR